MAIDELNVQKSIPYEQYFGEMELTSEQKKERIELAEKLEDKFMLVLSLVAVLSEFYIVDWENVRQQFKSAYMDVLGSVDGNLMAYIDNMSYKLMDSTRNNMEEIYNLSLDRAILMAENESNTLSNYKDYEKALMQGKTTKKWIDMKDGKVRHTHKLVGGKQIPIRDYFMVGNSLMRYPKDDLGEDKEIVGCRCSIKYF